MINGDLFPVKDSFVVTCERCPKKDSYETVIERCPEKDRFVLLESVVL